MDDDVNLLNLTSTVLKQQGHQVLSFTSAAEALETIENTDFDFIITDIQMPEIDGFLFVKKLKSKTGSFYKNQPIIAITGRTDLDFSIYTNAGFSTVINKPYSPKVLLETIQKVLDNTISFDNKIVKREEEASLQTYSLHTLKEFLGNDNESSKEFIGSFIESTIRNLQELENAVLKKNIAEVNAISHRMAPMFRQIQANEIGEILKTLEQNNLENSNLEPLLDNLKTKTDLLFDALKKEILF